MTVTPTVHSVRVFRDSGLWVIEVPDLGAVSQSRTLASAAAEARELVAVWLDVPVDHVEVEVDYSGVDPEAWRLITQARSTQSAADKMVGDAAIARRQAARRLVRDDGLSLRDAAAVLGVTFARVQQLVSD